MTVTTAMAQLRFVVVFLACASAVWQETDAHSSGAPTGACNTLIPEHEGTKIAKPEKPSYTLKAPQSVAAGSTTVVSIDGQAFKGFIVRSMDANGKGGGARFVGGEPGSRYQAISCDAPDDTVTHTDGADKKSIQLQWVAPSVPGTYRLMATIVQSYSAYHPGYFTDVIVV